MRPFWRQRTGGPTDTSPPEPSGPASYGFRRQDSPAAPDQAVGQPVVQAVRPALPELDLHRADAGTRPTTAAAVPRRPANRCATSPPARSSSARLGEQLALGGSPGAELGARAVGSGNRRPTRPASTGADRPAHPDLPLHGPPTEGQGGPRVGRRAHGPSAAAVRVEDEAPVVEPLQQDEPVGWRAVRASMWPAPWPRARLAGRLGLVEPPLELPDRVGIEVRLVQRPVAGPDPSKGLDAEVFPGQQRNPVDARGLEAGRHRRAAVEQRGGGDHLHAELTDALAARSNDAPVDTTSSTSTTRSPRPGAPLRPRPPGRGLSPPCESRTRTRPPAARLRAPGRPRPWSVRRRRRRAFPRMSITAWLASRRSGAARRPRACRRRSRDSIRRRSS